MCLRVCVFKEGLYDGNILYFVYMFVYTYVVCMFVGEGCIFVSEYVLV